MASAKKVLITQALPFSLLATRLAKDEDFLRDARDIIALDEVSYERLAEELAKYRGFLSRSELVTVIDNTLGDGHEKLAKIISAIARIIHDSGMSVTDAMNELMRAIDEIPTLPSNEREVLATRIKGLVARSEAIARQQKARQLVDATNSEIDGFRIICDIRPIFDPDHETIDGAIPLCILRLEYSSPDGEESILEARITERQLSGLGKEIEKAEQKLSIIKAFLATCRLPVPRTKATITEDAT